MVLDNATNEFMREDNFDSGNAPSSDTYTLNESPNTITMKFSDLPGAMKWNEAERKRLVPVLQARAKWAADLVGRPVQRDEADALAWNYAHAVGLGSYGRKTSRVVIAAYTGYELWKASRDKTFSSDLRNWQTPMNEAGRAQILKTPAVQRMVQLSKPLILAVICLPVADVIMGSYAATVMNVRDRRDPRLAEVSRAWEKKAQLAVQQRRGSASTTTAQETFEQRRQRESAQEMIRRKTNGLYGSDDASPTSDDQDATWQTQSTFSEAPPQEPSRMQQAVKSTTSLPTASTQSSEADNYIFGDRVEDTTKAKATTVMYNPREKSSTQLGTWDRIRQQAAEKAKENGRD